MMQPHRRDEVGGLQLQVTDKSPHNTRAAAVIAVAEAAAAAAAAVQEQEQHEELERRQQQLLCDQQIRQERQAEKKWSREQRWGSSGGGSGAGSGGGGAGEHKQLRRLVSHDELVPGSPAPASTHGGNSDGGGELSASNLPTRPPAATAVPSKETPTSAERQQQQQQQLQLPEPITSFTSLSGVRTSNLALGLIGMIALVLIILQFRLQTHHDVHHGHLPPQPGVAHKLHKKLVEAPHIKHALNAEPHEGNREKFGAPSGAGAAAATAGAAGAAAASGGDDPRVHPHHHLLAFGHEQPLDVYGATMMPVGGKGVVEQIVVGQTIAGEDRRRRSVYVHLPSNESMAVGAALRKPTLVAFHDRGGSALMLMKDMKPVVDLGGVAAVCVLRACLRNVRGCACVRVWLCACLRARRGLLRSALCAPRI